jgi:hypothetical protein
MSLPLLTDIVVAASITAVPATIAAWAALSANKKVSTNGSKKDIGLLVEELGSDLKDLSFSVQKHHADTKLHCQKCEEHIKNSRGFCDNCGNLM